MKIKNILDVLRELFIVVYIGILTSFAVIGVQAMFVGNNRAKGLEGVTCSCRCCGTASHSESLQAPSF